MPELPSVAAFSSPDFSELKTILDAAGTTIIATDVTGVVRTFNPAAERMIGWRAEEVIGKQTPALWHDAGEVALRAAELSRELGRTVPPGFEVFVAEVAAGETAQREWTFIRKDGSRFPVQLVVSALRDRTGQDKSMGIWGPLRI